MTRRRRAGLMLLFLAGATTARAEVIQCTEITSVPYYISTPGLYCLKGPLAYGTYNGYAIRIDADDVVLDLNGHVLDGSAAGAGTQALGVYGAMSTANVTIRNGTIRGFSIGVVLGNSAARGHVLEWLHADRNTTIGLYVRGQGGIVRNNRVTATGGTTSTSHVVGIAGDHGAIHVVDNEVFDTREAPGGPQLAYGIRVTTAHGAVIARNLISNRAIGPFGSRGIYLGSCVNVTVAGNRVSHMGHGIMFSGSTGLYLDNTVVGATTPFTGGTAAGTTNFSF